MTPPRRLAAVPDSALLAEVRGAVDAVDAVPAHLIESCRDLTAVLDRAVGVERPPSGCGWCGIAQRSHTAGEWHPVAKFHGYAAPSQDQIKTRMLRRRRYALRLREAA